MSRQSWMPHGGPGLALRPDQLRAMGVTRSRLAASGIERAFRGSVLLPSTAYDPDSMVDRCLAFGPLMRPGWFFTRRSAAALWGIPVPDAPNGAIEVGAVRPRHAPRRRNVRGHEISSGILRTGQRYGLPVPMPADVWCVLAPVISLGELVAVGDFLLSGTVRRPRVPLATIADLRESEQRFRGTPGAPARREAIELLRSPVDSRPESLMRLAMHRAGLPAPVVSCPVMVAGRNGPIELHSDIGFPQWKIAGEYEGGVHFTDLGRARRDVERWELMTDAGWRVVRATARDLPDFGEFTTRLRRIIAERGGS